MCTTNRGPEHRGKMVSLATAIDRTLYFDFLPLRVPKVRGMGVRLQLFTVPGQVYYNATRKLVLTGSDGVVFVADSQGARADANLESFENLRENLFEQKRDLGDLPHVLSIQQARPRPRQLDRRTERASSTITAPPAVPTVATSGEGVSKPSSSSRAPCSRPSIAACRTGRRARVDGAFASRGRPHRRATQRIDVIAASARGVGRHRELPRFAAFGPPIRRTTGSICQATRVCSRFRTVRRRRSMSRRSKGRSPIALRASEPRTDRETLEHVISPADSEPPTDAAKRRAHSLYDAASKQYEPPAAEALAARHPHAMRDGGRRTPGAFGDDARAEWSTSKRDSGPTRASTRWRRSRHLRAPRRCRSGRRQSRAPYRTAAADGVVALVGLLVRGLVGKAKRTRCAKRRGGDERRFSPRGGATRYARDAHLGERRGPDWPERRASRPALVPILPRRGWGNVT